MAIRHTYIGILTGLAVLVASPTFAQTIEVEPGLWSYDTVVFLASQQVHSEQSRECINVKDSKRNLDDLVDQLRKEGNCSITNVRHTPGHGEADAICQNNEFGTARGKISADYTKVRYVVKADAMVDFYGLQLPLKSKTIATRSGECPAKPAEPKAG